MLANIWETDGGVYFGHQCATPADPDLPLNGDWTARPELHRYTGDRHLITIGPNGSGKTRRLLVPNLAMLKSWSCLVVDPKGELAVQTAAHRMAAGSEIITLDPFRVIERQYPQLVETLKDASGRPVLRSAGLNPMVALDPQGDDFPDDAKAIAEAIIEVNPKDSQPHFAQSARTLLAGLIMGLRVRFPDSATFDFIRALIGGPPSELADFISKQLLAHLPEDQAAARAKLGRFKSIAEDNREILGMISTAVTQTDWLDSRPIQRDLNGGAIAFDRMKQAPMTVYLILPPRYLETHATWLRMMITAVLTPLLRTTAGKVPVLFMLDEFAQLGRLEVIERNMALMRGYGVKLWPVFQDLAQAQDVYAKRWESFISNAGVLQSFAPQDVTTREYLSKLSGQRLYWLKTIGTNTGESVGPQNSKSSGMTEGWSNMQGPIYWPQGLASMKDGQAVLFAKGRAPRSWLPDPTEIDLTRTMLAAAESAAR